MKIKLLFIAIALFVGVGSYGQTLFDTFSDGNFSATPVWGGSTTAWGIQANSDAAAGATGSNTLRLAAPAVAQTDYLSSQIATWGSSQEWGFWLGRRAQAFTAANQSYFWLYANEANLTSATVDGYRIAIGDDTGGDDIRLEYILNGAINTTVITSSVSVNTGLTDIGFLVRVTRSATGVWAIFTSTLPTANATGAIASAVPNATNAAVSQGTATNNTVVPATNGYIGLAALHSTGANAIMAQEFDQIYFTPVSACTDPSLAFATSSYSKNVGDANFTQTATTDSAGAVTYSSSDTAVATVNSSTGEVTLGTVGTATITATQEADGTYCLDTATYTVDVTSTTPSITFSGTLTGLSTTYGTASANTTFSVSAANLTNNLIITPPSGFEVSTSAGSGFVTSLDLGTSNRTNTTIYVRLAATTPFGTYNGNITLASTGVTTVNVATASSTVAKKTLTIAGLTGENKIYDGTTTASLSGTATLTGILFSDDVTLSGTPTSNFADKNVGTGKIITTTGYTLAGTKAANYSVTQPSATANITARSLSISAPTIASKIYDSSAVSGTVTVGTLSNLVGTETLGVSVSGLYTDATVGTGKSATITYVLANGSNGGLATNYSLANGTTAGDITKANPLFTTSTIAINIGGTYILSGANVVTTSDGTLSYSITGGSFATLLVNTITGASVGTETLTVNQEASTNYNEGSTTVSVIVSACSPPIWEENFDYGSCENAHIPNITSNWTRFSGSGNDAKYSASGLTYGTYPSSGIGGSFSFETGGTDDVRREFSSTGINSGSVYASFLINMNTNTNTTDDYFISLIGDPSSGITYHGRVYIKKDGTQYRLGVGKQSSSGSAADVNTSLLNFDQTYLIVVKYEFISGSTNDPFKLWVISSGIPSSEATAGTFITATLSGTDATNLKSFAIRQTNKPKGFVDGIRVATSWESLLCDNTPTAITYTWTGANSTSWANSGNWSPSGIPSSIDNIIINSVGTNTLNITDCRTVKDFTFNGTGAFSASATGALSINGNVTYGGTPTANLDCASQIFIKSTASQPVPPLTYGNLDVLGGNRVFSPTGIIKICSAFNVNSTLYTYTVTGSTVEYISPASVWEMALFTYNNLTFSGTGSFSFGSSSPAVDKTINVLGDFVQSNSSVLLGDTNSKTATINIDGNMTINSGNFDVNKISGGKGIINLKGDLSVSTTGQLTATIGGGKINFVGIGDGSSDPLTQTIDIKNTNSVYYTAFSVNSGFVKIANQDLYLGTNSSFEVKSGAIFNFGFGADNLTALNIVRVNSRIGQTFNANSGSTLKLTSPLGITTSGTYTGNLQIGAAGANRTFDPAATYHYIGKANQVSGNGLPSAITSKVIVELDTDTLTFNSSGNKTIASGGTLEIRKGIVVDDSTNSFGDDTTNANLTMSGGRYKISKTGTQPTLSGTYNLTAGVVEYASSQATAETVRTKSYQNIEVTGNNVGNSGGNITLNHNGTFTLKNGGIFTINADAIVGQTGTTQTVTVENGGIFKTGDVDGFNGGTGLTATSVRSDVENIILNSGSTVEYSGANQTITTLPFPTPYSANTTTYSNLKISGTGDKKLPSAEVLVNNDLEVVTGTNLIIEADKLLTVANKITAPTATENIFINDNGSLVQINDGAVNTGKINMERKTTPVINTDYTYWSTPVTGFSLGDVTPTPLFFYSYDSNASPEDWKEEIATKIMDPGIGYIIRAPEPTGLPYTPTRFTANFIGVPNNGGVTGYSITNILADKSYLLGNPYPSALDADTFLAANVSVIDGTLYFWTHNTEIQLATNITNGTAGSGILAYTSDDYASYNGVGGTATIKAPSGTAGNNSYIPTGKIASGQGFFASSLATQPSAPANKIVYNNSMRVRATTNNNQFFRTTNTNKTAIEKHRIWLNLSNSQGAFKQTLVGYLTNATNEYDTRFDGESYDANEFVDFYSINNSKNLVIQGRSLPFVDSDLVPIGYRTKINDAFTINIDQADGVLTNQDIYLEDKLLNIVHNLKTSAYTFNTTAGTFNERFVLRYTNRTLGINDLSLLENQVLISNKNKQIKVNSLVESINKVIVYDITGKQIFAKDKINTNEFVLTNLVSSQQTVLVKIVLVNGETVTKKVMY